MQRIPTLSIALLVAACHSTEADPQPEPRESSAPAVQSAAPPGQEATSEQHRWLAALAGEWSVTSEVVMEEGAEPQVWNSTESVRTVGDLWIVIEGSTIQDGEPFTSLLTLGYDPAKELFVGSWVDSLQPKFWTYEGSLDQAGRTLTLKAQGPSFWDPEATASYLDRIEILGPDRRRMTSSTRARNGEWHVFMTSEARRVD